MALRAPPSPFSSNPDSQRARICSSVPPDVRLVTARLVELIRLIRVVGLVELITLIRVVGLVELIRLIRVVELSPQLSIV